MTDKQTENKTEKLVAKKKTRFSGIADKRGKLPVEPEPEVELESSPAPMSGAAAAVISAAPPAPAADKAKARQPGKKDNPDYVQVTVYLRKDIYKTARKLLIDDGRQVSELVDALVSKWIESREK
jgi:hypothetical protein